MTGPRSSRPCPGRRPPPAAAAPPRSWSPASVGLLLRDEDGMIWLLERRPTGHRPGRLAQRPHGRGPGAAAAGAELLVYRTDPVAVDTVGAPVFHITDWLEEWRWGGGDRRGPAGRWAGRGAAGQAEGPPGPARGADRIRVPKWQGGFTGRAGGKWPMVVQTRPYGAISNT